MKQLSSDTSIITLCRYWAKRSGARTRACSPSSNMAAFVGSQHLDLFDDLPHATKLGVGLRAALAFLGGETERKPATHRR